MLLLLRILFYDILHQQKPNQATILNPTPATNLKDLDDSEGMHPGPRKGSSSNQCSISPPVNLNNTFPGLHYFEGQHRQQTLGHSLLFFFSGNSDESVPPIYIKSMHTKRHIGTVKYANKLQMNKKKGGNFHQCQDQLLLRFAPFFHHQL